MSREPWRPSPAIAASLLAHGAAPLALALRPADWGAVLAGLALNHALLGACMLWPSRSLLGPTLRRLPQPGGAVALTFDDGPDPAVTPAVLDLLERHGAHATFFCIGARAARHPRLVRDIRRRGHAIGNHTMRHVAGFAARTMAGQRREIASAQTVLAADGPAPRLFRAPLGLRSPLLDPVLHELGLTHVSWTRRGLDTRRGDPAAILRGLTGGLGAGDILLLHDGNVARTAGGVPVVLPVLAALLPLLAARGLRSVSLEDWVPHDDHAAAIAAMPAAAAATGSPA